MKTYDLILDNLERHCLGNVPNHYFKEVYTYSLIPAGKLFRPLLATYIHMDKLGEDKTIKELENLNSNLSLACSSLEMHHTYTLIHDDLPCMDDDAMRRGRESTHKKFGQWQALLSGDGLQALSYRMISQIKCKSNMQILKVFSWALGAKGLIHGQALDLDISKNKSFEQILLVHKLKTARLIQTAVFMGTAIAKNSELNLKEIKKCLKTGEALGLTFQLLDDLIDLYEDQQDHEKEINPWEEYFEQSLNETIKYIQTTKEFFKENPNTSQFISMYLQKTVEKLNKICPKNELVKYRLIISELESVD